MNVRLQNNRSVGCWPKLAASLLLVALLFAPAGSAQKKQKLAQNYKEWLEQEVVYIITKEERERFAKLPNDEARDKFIKDFWEIRNPSPGSEVNTYKEEIYQRIAFANSRFGVGSGSDGWRTDRGHVYITLGPPQSKQYYRNAANLRPFEIWFYANAHPALPTAFYVLFYDRDNTGDYRIYSPYNDGPDKLTTGVEAINSPTAGLSMIQNSVGAEVARISLSLIVGEPVDTSNPRPSLSSDVMLSILTGLSEQPSYRDDIRRKWMNRETVSSSMILQGHNLDIILLPVRDDHGLTRVDYSLRLKNPSDLSLSELPNDKLGYSLQVRIQVFDGDNSKLLFVAQKDLHDTFDRGRFHDTKDRCFSYEGTLPLPSGHYRLAFQFTDWNKNVSYRTERDLSVPKVEPGKFIIPGILPFTSAEQVDPIAAEVLPFTMAGVQFTPMSTANLMVNAEQDLQLTYQIWTAPNNPELAKTQNLDVEYGLGQPAVPGSAKVMKDQVATSQFNSTGSLVSGKKLKLDGNFGNYLLNLSVNGTDPSSKGFAKLNIKATDPAALPPAPWILIDQTIREDREKGVFDMQRGLCYLDQNSLPEGRAWMRRALAADHSNELARARLVEAYFDQKDYAAVAALYKDTGVTDGADSSTLLRIATSLHKLGNDKEGVRLLEHGADVRSTDGSMYLALGDFYTQLGNQEKATAAIQKGRQLTQNN